MFASVQFDGQSDTPLYRQLYEHIKTLVWDGKLLHGERLPATRELASQLGLNRTTISAAYDLLEADGLVRGHVGRGSFIFFERPASTTISFASSRPSQADFPLTDFQEVCREVINGPEARTILQLGSPAGYGPLREYLLDQSRAEGVAGPDDDVLITSGCQQALDLLQRSLISQGEPVVIEDPTYHGIKNVFTRPGVRVAGVPVDQHGLNLEHLARTVAAERPKMIVVTPNFQNPTGSTLSSESRGRILQVAKQFGTVVVENDIYRELRYMGDSLPALKQLDISGGTILIRSFSKIAFPGLRVGWIIASRRVIAGLTETRQWCDLHTDQLSQAVLLRFAQSGRLTEHASRVRFDGARRLHAVLRACENHLPAGSTFTRPEGGMSLWVRLPEGLDSTDLLPRAQRENVSYSPGRLFAVSEYDPRTLRLSFGGLSPEQIETGLERLGRLFSEELASVRTARSFEVASAVV